MKVPVVDAIIAVHTTRRPIDRAVGSIVDHADAAVRVTVVCHGVSNDTIAERLGPLAEHPRVRLTEHDDGIPSPAGPFNAGLDMATAEYTTILGSDDEFEPHAVDAWLSTARQTGARAVICRQRFVSGKLARTPITRPWRRHRLDPVRDRLAYRTAPLGLLATREFGKLRFSGDLTTGEDIAYGLRVWFSGAPLSFDRGAPGYVVHDEDGADRTTATIRDVADEFAFVARVIEAPWFDRLHAPARTAIGVKLLRSHVVPAVLVRARNGRLVERDATAFNEIVERIVTATAPKCTEVLSRRDAGLLRALSGGPAAVLRTAAHYGHGRTASTLLPDSAARIFDRESPLRLLAAAASNRS